MKRKNRKCACGKHVPVNSFYNVCKECLHDVAVEAAFGDTLPNFNIRRVR